MSGATALTSAFRKVVYGAHGVPDWLLPLRGWSREASLIPFTQLVLQEHFRGAHWARVGTGPEGSAGGGVVFVQVLIAHALHIHRVKGEHSGREGEGKYNSLTVVIISISPLECNHGNHRITLLVT